MWSVILFERSLIFVSYMARFAVKNIHPKDVTCQGFEGRFTLRWRSPPVINPRGILKVDWLRATLVSGGGLHYGQESFGREHCTWMKKWHGCQRRGHFSAGEFSGGRVSWATSKPCTRNLTSGELQIKYFIVFSSSLAYLLLPQITMSWAELLDQLVHFSTVV